MLTMQPISTGLVFTGRSDHGDLSIAHTDMAVKQKHATIVIERTARLTNNKHCSYRTVERRWTGLFT